MAGTHEEVTDSKMLEKNISDPVPLQEFPPKPRNLGTDWWRRAQFIPQHCLARVLSKRKSGTLWVGLAGLNISDWDNILGKQKSWRCLKLSPLFLCCQIHMTCFLWRVYFAVVYFAQTSNCFGTAVNSGLKGPLKSCEFLGLHVALVFPPKPRYHSGISVKLIVWKQKCCRVVASFI